MTGTLAFVTFVLSNDGKSCEYRTQEINEHQDEPSIVKEAWVRAAYSDKRLGEWIEEAIELETARGKREGMS